jgi:hypothetical protein
MTPEEIFNMFFGGGATSIFFGRRPLVPLLLLGPPFFPINVFFWGGGTTLLPGMTSISLHMQWPLTSLLHGSVSQRGPHWFFVTDQTPRDLEVLCARGCRGRFLKK